MGAERVRQVGFCLEGAEVVEAGGGELEGGGTPDGGVPVHEFEVGFDLEGGGGGVAVDAFVGGGEAEAFLGLGVRGNGVSDGEGGTGTRWPILLTFASLRASLSSREFVPRHSGTEEILDGRVGEG